MKLDESSNYYVSYQKESHDSNQTGADVVKW